MDQARSLCLFLLALVIQSIICWRWPGPKPFKIACFHFEVFGDVQDVHFKDYTKRVAEEYNLRGYVTYTKNNSVRGYVEGPDNYIPYMAASCFGYCATNRATPGTPASNLINMFRKKWLQERGSPQARIDKVVFYDERYINEFRYKVFHSLLLDFRDFETHQEPWIG